MRSPFRAGLTGWLLASLFAIDAHAIQITGTRRLTTDLADQYNPVISGNTVVYTDMRAGNADIYLFDLTTGGEINITDDPANQLLNDVFGEFVVYSDYRTGVAQVWAYHVPSAQSCRITYSNRPSLSPSIGSELLVFQDQVGTDTEIAAFDLSALDTNDLPASCAALANGSLPGPQTLDLGPGRQLSPKSAGKWIVYQGTDANNQPRIFAYDTSTALVVPMPDHGKAQLLPDASGDRVAYIEDDGTNRDVVMYDLATSTFVQVTQDAYRQNFPSISGNFIAFEDSRAGNLDIYVYDLSNGALTPLTQDPANQYLNSIDDGSVVFTDASAGNLDVVLVTFESDPPPPPPPPCDDETKTLATVALDDEANIVRREYRAWPRLSKPRTGGDFLDASDHHRITYRVSVDADAPQASITVHAQRRQSGLPSALLAAGLEAKSGLVIRANGAEQRWDDPNNDVADLTLVARRNGPDAVIELAAAREVRIPAFIAVTAGNAHRDEATLSFRVDGEEITCTYRGSRARWFIFDECEDGERDSHGHWHGGHHGHHRHWHHRHSDRDCHGGDDLAPGDILATDRVSLFIDGASEAVARVYAVSSAGSDEWTDVAFTAPLPLFAGANEVTLEGPEYAKSFLRFRPISFANGGSLQATAKVACTSQPTTIAACDDPTAEVLYGPETFVRHTGAPEAVAFNYAASTSGAAQLCVTNGAADGTLRASSAVIVHNGETVFGPSDFSPQVSALGASVAAQLVNEGSVELRSAPGSLVTVKVVRAAVVAAPPVTTPDIPAASTPPADPTVTEGSAELKPLPRIHLGDCSAQGPPPSLWLLAVFFLLLRRRRR